MLVALVGCSHQPTTPLVDPSSPRAVAFLDTLEQRTFNYFWERADQTSGLVPDRWPTPSFSSIAAVGFGLTAYPIGVERGYVTRAAAAQRVLATLRYFWSLPQGPGTSGVAGYRGFFYHFLDMGTGLRYQSVELSSIDTGLLLAGALFCREYFTGADSVETAIRQVADSLYLRVDWQWMRPRPPLLAMGWKPESGGAFLGSDWHGYNEAMILYLLALGSPTHPVDSTAWAGWTAGYPWGSYQGQAHVGFAPLFGHEFSHVWVDFRGIQDAYMAARGIDYFENSRRAALAQEAYAVKNPQGWTGYGAGAWGLTASDGPADQALQVNGSLRQFHTYYARGASFTEVVDDGTIAPTAAGGAVPFAPELAIPALVAMRERWGEPLFGQYGFLDAFNPSWPGGTPQMGQVVAGKGWFDTDYLGIDEGPIVAMVENYRSGLVWRVMKNSPYIVAGLKRAGFTGGWLVGK